MDLDDPIYTALYKYTKAMSAALGYRDLMTRLHSERVHALATAIGRGCGLASKELGILGLAASFHDIGKIGTPDRILLKPSPLDDVEREVMKQHAEIGERIIAATELEGSREVSLVIRHHHEHYDGTGYPDGLSGEHISICSRIIAIADSYDAMAVTRSYRNAKSHREVMAVLHDDTEGKYDPELIRVFSELVESSSFKAS